MFKEFKEFATRGNVLDMAIGVIMGGAFSNIVNSLVKDIIMPLVGLLFGGHDLSGQSIPLGNKGNALNYGNFLQFIINFLIIALALFFLVKGINKLRNLRSSDASTEEERHCPFCMSVVDEKATRCPFCTSQLADSPHPAESVS